MASKLEQLAITQRSSLINPNLYKQSWVGPLNFSNNYSVVHTRAISDSKTPIYGKGTGIFLDTENGGGEYDINGNPNHAGSGRINAINLNESNWSYTPSKPYSVTNTRALSDKGTPIYGKGTGIFLDTENGGGEHDINGNPNYAGSGRVNAINLNTSNWSYGPNTPYSVTNIRALSDKKTPIHGKGTGIFLDTENGGGTYDIDGNPKYGGSGRVNALNINTYNKLSFYNLSHSRALSDNTTPYNGKGTNDASILNEGNNFTLAAHTNYNGGSKDDKDARNSLMNNPFNPFNLNNQYSVSNPRAISNGDIHGKGENPKSNGQYLNDTQNYTTIGSKDDIDARDSTKSGVNTNIYRPDTTTNDSQYTDNQYDLRHKNALATGDVKGKGTNDGIALDGTYAAHTNYNGGNSIDIAKRTESNVKNVTVSKVNKPFGYGYDKNQDYLSNRPLYNDDADKINVGKISF